MLKIQSRFTEHLLVPDNGLDRNTSTYETMDGFACVIKYEATWADYREYEEEMELICQRFYQCSFSTIKSIWIGRLGFLDKVWHLIKMEKV